MVLREFSWFSGSSQGILRIIREFSDQANWSSQGVLREGRPSAYQWNYLQIKSMSHGSQSQVGSQSR